jgi:hypothetical protein
VWRVTAERALRSNNAVMTGDDAVLIVIIRRAAK